jgi:predicted nucleotidyltransferase component of viral defense system
LTVQEAIRTARERARQMKLDPSLTIAEVYEAELLRRLQQKLKGGLVWKGGTVLRLEGSERFSRDLDASRRSTALAAGQIVKLLQGIAEGLAYLKGVSIKRQPQSVVAAYRLLLRAYCIPCESLLRCLSAKGF